MNKKLNNESYFLNLLILGDSKIGKTSLIKKYCENKFTEKYYPTIGIDYGVKKVNFDNLSFIVNIFDLSGENEYKEIRKNFYKNVQICLICYNVNKLDSIKNLSKWEKEIRNNLKNSNTSFYIVGCKSDKENNDMNKLAKKFSNEKNYPLFITSSFNSSGIDDLFNSIFKKLKSNIINNNF